MAVHYPISKFATEPVSTCHMKRSGGQSRSSDREPETKLVNHESPGAIRCAHVQEEPVAAAPPDNPTPRGPLTAEISDRLHPNRGPHRGGGGRIYPDVNVPKLKFWDIYI